MTVKKAIIPCAGFGTRFLPVTKVLPKELLPIVDTPALSYIVEEAALSGIEEVLIILSPQKLYIKKLFEPNEPLNEMLLSTGKAREYGLANKKYGVKISYAVQPVMNGNANAIALGRDFAAGEPFAVLFGDDVMYTGQGKPVTAQLIDAFERTGGATIVGCQRPSEEVARKCGVMMVREMIDDKLAWIDGIVEKPKGELPSDLVSLGRFVLSNEIFDVVERTPVTDGEKYLTDAIGLLAKEGKKVCACAFDARRYDIGDKEGYLEAIIEFALRDEALSGKFSEYIKNLEE